MINGKGGESGRNGLFTLERRGRVPSGFVGTFDMRRNEPTATGQEEPTNTRRE
jgi:hypothetical protein